MKKILIIIVLSCALKTIQAQVVLAVPTVTQQQTEWCWAGCTNSILSYYGLTVPQCQIADYARTVATWHNYGTVNCCTNPSVGCNYWNYNWGSVGSIEDILSHFASIPDIRVSNYLSFATITSEINAGRPFVIRWGWTTGGGHFIVGKGYNSTNQSVYYMNPWPGEGAKIATYTWMKSDGSHDWTHTNQLTVSPSVITAINEENISNDILIYPNPANEKINIKSLKTSFTSVKLIDVNGKVIYNSKNTNTIDISDLNLSKGIYILDLSSESSTYHKKIIID